MSFQIVAGLFAEKREIDILADEFLHHPHAVNAFGQRGIGGA